MTSEQIEQFHKDFKDIISLNQLIKDNAKYLHNLHLYDKKGSHEKAILKALEQRRQLNSTLAAVLRGADYEGWKMVAKKLSLLKSKLKVATERMNKAIAQKEKAEIEIDNLNFEL
jgi:hypothetical protein